LKVVVNLGTKSRKLGESISQRLKTVRLERSVSLTKLAELTGLNRQTISFMESGANSPSIETFARIRLGS